MDHSIRTVEMHRLCRSHALLKDGVLVSKYEKEYKEKDEFIRMILKDWLSRDDDDPNDSAACSMHLAWAICHLPFMIFASNKHNYLCVCKLEADALKWTSEAVVK